MVVLSDKAFIMANSSQYRYVQREHTLLKNESVKWYNFFLLENQETLEVKVSEYTDFFYETELLNRSINTKKNNYGNIMLIFLNYIFFDRDIPIESINDITVEVGNEFLDSYAYGRVGGTTTKSNGTIDKARSSLTSFYHWLSKKRIYKLKTIKPSIFISVTKTYTSRTTTGIKHIERKTIKPIFKVEFPNITSNQRLEKPSEFLAYELIEIAKQYDPMMAFPIALQTFAGIRRGEVCQMAQQRIMRTAPYGRSINFVIDLRHELMLRDDGKRTGKIKRLRIQLVYEAFLPYLDKLYRDHKAILQQQRYDDNKYGALVIGNNGKAMTTDRYAQRFNNLVRKLTKRVMEMANKKHYQASLDINLLLNYKMTPHSLRFFFTQYVARRENTHTLAMYRGDLNLNTALTYLKDSAYRTEYIHKLQNSFEESYHKFTGDNLNEV